MPKLSFMYACIILFLGLPCFAQTGPVIEFDNDTVDFGEMAQHSEQEFEFIFRNTGNQPLEIVECNSFCDCMIIQEVTEEIRPGGKGSIKGIFTSQDYVDEVERMIEIKTNEKGDNTYVLTITAFVVETIIIEPHDTMVFPGEAENGVVKKELTIESADKQLFTVAEIITNVDFIKAEVVKDKNNKMKSKHEVAVYIDRSNIPQFGYYFIAVQLVFVVEYKDNNKENVEQKTMLLIFNDDVEF
jgi:hypothetical protein